MARVERVRKFKARAGKTIGIGDKDNPIATLEVIEVKGRTVEFIYNGEHRPWIADTTSAVLPKSQQPPTGQPEVPQ